MLPHKPGLALAGIDSLLFFEGGESFAGPVRDADPQGAGGCVVGGAGVIGATAFPVYGYARATLDVDLFIDAERGNAERTRTALAEFGYDVTDATVDDLLTKKISTARRQSV